jgi:DNA-binding transcriptional LysR family regulator
MFFIISMINIHVDKGIVMISLTQLQIFIKVSETGSFTKAADELNFTQSGISHTIAGLEKDLGLLLFNRSKNGVELTQAGNEIIVYARETLNQIEKIQQTSTAFLGVETGTIKIGGFPSIMAKFLPKLMLEFQKKYPKIKFSLFEGTYEEVNEMINKGVIDLGFTVEQSKGLEFEPLIEDYMVVVFSEDHCFAGKTMIEVQEMAEETFIKDIGCERYLKDIFQYESTNMEFEIRDLNIILSMIQEGLGITILPQMSIPNQLYKIQTAILNPLVNRKIGISYRAKNRMAPASTVFLNFINDWFKHYSKSTN